MVVFRPAFIAQRANVVAGAVRDGAGSGDGVLPGCSRPRSIAAPRHGKEICKEGFTALEIILNEKEETLPIPASFAHL